MSQQGDYDKIMTSVQTSWAKFELATDRSWNELQADIRIMETTTNKEYTASRV